MRTIHREIVSAVIFSSDNKILLGKKYPKSGGAYTQGWSIPGGGADEREKFEDTVKREVKEETRLVIESVDEVSEYHGEDTCEKILKDTGEKVMCHMNFHVFMAKLDKSADEVKLSSTEEYQEIKWFSLDELVDLDIPFACRDLFVKLGYVK